MFDVDRKGDRGILPSMKLRYQSNSTVLHIIKYINSTTRKPLSFIHVGDAHTHTHTHTHTHYISPGP